jgi:acyl dehydratase
MTATTRTAKSGHTPEVASLSVGQSLEPITRQTSVVQVFRYSAATWNTHRIHFDLDYAKQEGYPGVLVQSHLHGAFVTQYCTDWMGPHGSLVSLSVAVKRFAVAGDSLTCSGTVTELVKDGDDLIVHLDINETRDSDGAVCVPAKAVIRLPNDPGSEGPRS